MAEIPASYLACLRDLELALEDGVVVNHVDVVISETGDELLEIVRAVLWAAPALPPAEERAVVSATGVAKKHVDRKSAER